MTTTLVAGGIQRRASAKSQRLPLINGREYNIDHQTLCWLQCELDRESQSMLHIVLLNVPEVPESSRRNEKLFKGVVRGSTNLKVSNVLDHPTSEVHKVAHESRFYKKERQVHDVVI